MERADEVREAIKAIRDKTQYLRRTLGRTLSDQILSVAEAAERLLDGTCSLDLLRAWECGLFEAAVLHHNTNIYLAQYQRQLEKFEFTVYRKDAAAIQQMIDEIRRRVADVVEQAYRCYSK